MLAGGAISGLTVESGVGLPRSRVILHVDMDAYFASVEALANPALRQLPVIVGGRPGGRGVVATASYAARTFGIRPGMSIAEAARRCRDAVFLPGDPPKYIFYSIRMLEILREFSPLVEPFSIDEAFIEISGQVNGLHAGRDIGIRIQNTIDHRLGLSASIGIGPNKLLAKMASSMEKPHGITMLDRDGFQRRFWAEPAGELWGIGDKTAAALAIIGIRTIGDLARAPREILLGSFGVVGGVLRHMARGEDETPLIPYNKGVPIKSMGHEHTLARDEADGERLDAHLLRLTEQVARRLRRAGMQGRTVTVKIRFSNFRTITRQRTLSRSTDEERTIYPVARDLLHRDRGHLPLRLLGVALSGLMGGESTGFLFSSDRRHREVLGAVDHLRDRFGEHVMTRARILAGLHGNHHERPSHPRSLRSRLAGS